MGLSGNGSGGGKMTLENAMPPMAPVASNPVATNLVQPPSQTKDAVGAIGGAADVANGGVQGSKTLLGGVS